MGAYNSILLRRQFEVPISADFLAKILSSKKDDDLNVRIIDKYNYKILSYSSFGTLIGGGILMDGIKIYTTLQPASVDKTLIILKTRFRIDLYFIIFVSLIFVLIGSTSNTFPLWSMFIFPLVTIWFWFIYRAQENKLADEVEAYLIKQPRMGWSELK